MVTSTISPVISELLNVESYFVIRFILWFKFHRTRLEMAEDRAKVTQFIKGLIKAGVFVAATTLGGGLALGPVGLSIGAGLATTGLIATRSIPGAGNGVPAGNLWMAIITIILPITVELAIENWDVIVEYARKLINMIYNIINRRDISHENNLALPPPPPPPVR